MSRIHPSAGPERGDPNHNCVTVTLMNRDGALATSLSSPRQTGLQADGPVLVPLQTVPYDLPLPGGVMPRMLITIMGTVKPNADR